MTPELYILGWTLVLAIFQILLPSHFRNRETGIAYNVSARDAEGPPVGVVTGRLQRAQKNLFETLPLFIAAILIAHVADIHTSATYWGAWVYLIARVIYLPVYALGIPYLRSMVWVVSMVGLSLIIWTILSL